MGEATFYLKARFQNRQQAKQAATKLESFLEESSKAYDYWQERRMDAKPAQFWKEFADAFPRVHALLSRLGKVNQEDCNNSLAGNLGFTGIEDPDVGVNEDSCVYYSATVWHFANWDGLVDYCKHDLGAVNADYLSDEYMDPFDALSV